jgi:hypothetical protein
MITKVALCSRDGASVRTARGLIETSTILSEPASQPETKSVSVQTLKIPQKVPISAI